MKKILLQKEQIDIEKAINEVGTEEDGAVVFFIGRPRKDSSICEVKYIEYEAFHSMAVKEIEKIINDAFQKWPITDCIVIHRFGRVELREASIIIAVSSHHREEAFSSVKYIIDTIKKTVPIWKTEFYFDGTSRVYDRS
ncbi:MAG: molybdenum cofactor biosynthesis protein MoaE [Spirochaetes bacterium]|nr:molybdenum cofactor biosynthesis protein MoaE [Spirochaetota bacterium]